MSICGEPVIAQCLEATIGQACSKCKGGQLTLGGQLNLGELRVRADVPGIILALLLPESSGVVGRRAGLDPVFAIMETQ